ncbi:hypothetical protein M758_5G029100 [Ceratodon purpureus]|nr:hypothetical protein M758_5G029100 [Ceratodon purpureus]
MQTTCTANSSILSFLASFAADLKQRDRDDRKPFGKSFRVRETGLSGSTRRTCNGAGSFTSNGVFTFSAVARWMPAGAVRSLYAAATGIVLSWYSFGPVANLFYFLPVVVGYGSMLLARQHCGAITFVAAFGFLLTWDLNGGPVIPWYRSEFDSWDLDRSPPGAFMVLILKVISVSMNYQDGLIKNEEELRSSQKKNLVKNLPSPVQYLGYCFNCGTHLAGPVYEFNDYMDWAEDKGLWSLDSARPFPSPFGAAFGAFLQALLCMSIYMFMLPRFPLSKFASLEYQKWGFWHRLKYMYSSGFTARWKYYFVWSLSESSMIISGLGFSGWTAPDDDKVVKAKWTRAKNVDIVKVEFAKSGVELPMYWNISVSTWLRHYVYERLVPRGGKAGFSQLLTTQVVSAVWHGLHTGYLLYFIHSALMISGSKVIFKWQSALPEKAVWARALGHLINGLFVALVNNYAAIGFLLLSYQETLQAFSSVYYVGTVVPIAIILFGHFVKPPRAGSTVHTKKIQ